MVCFHDKICLHFIAKHYMNFLCSTNIWFYLAYLKIWFLSIYLFINILFSLQVSISRKYISFDWSLLQGWNLCFKICVCTNLFFIYMYSSEVKIINMMLAEMLTWGVENKSFWIINETRKAKSDDSMEIEILKILITGTKF